MSQWPRRRSEKATVTNHGAVIPLQADAPRCEHCASEADICIHGVCFGCLAYALEPVRIDVDAAAEADDPFVFVQTAQVGEMIAALDKLWAALKPERLR